ncbi:MAG: KilA-N domain-containing protein [Patescibacteria group bacterium]
MAKSKKITVQGKQISIILHKGDDDFISLTDMLRAKDGDFFISDWLRNRNTVEFLGIWEKLHNPNFNYGEFATIRNRAGLNNYKISVKEWVKKTNAIGLKAIAGRYGGTYAHKDIAFEFGMWISPEFKIYLIKEFQRLKKEESQRLALGWDIKRILAKVNYKIHTDAVKQHLVPPLVKVAERYPKLKVIITHYFWPKMKYCYEITKNIPNIYFETAGMGDSEVITASGGIDVVKEILSRTITDREDQVLFGTDWPMCKIEDHINLIKSLNLTEKVEAKIFAGNANKIYRLEIV